MNADLNRKIQEMRGLGMQVEQKETPEISTITKVLTERTSLDENSARKVARDALGNGKNGTLLVNGNEVKTEDFAYELALSLQVLHSETDPMEEYFSWLSDAKQIALDMTDGEVTELDLKNKIDFLNDLDTRESEMKAVMALYKNSNYPGAKKQLAFLDYKWQRLMEIRAGLKNNTKNEVTNRPLNQEEKINAQAVAVIYTNLARQGVERAKNGDYAIDENGVFAFERNGYACTYVGDKFLMQYGFKNGIQLGKSMADRLIDIRANKNTDSKEALVDKIKMLRMGLSNGAGAKVVDKRVLTVDRMQQIMQEDRQYM